MHVASYSKYFSLFLSVQATLTQLFNGNFIPNVHSNSRIGTVSGELHFTVFHYTAVLHYCTTLLHYTAVHYCTVALDCSVLYCTTLYRTVLHCTMYYTTLYCAVLYCTALHYSIHCIAEFGGVVLTSGVTSSTHQGR